MVKLKNKVYWPTRLLTNISIGIVITSGFAVEGAKSLEALIIPGSLIIVFGLIAMYGTCRDDQ